MRQNQLCRFLVACERVQPNGLFDQSVYPRTRLHLGSDRLRVRRECGASRLGGSQYGFACGSTRNQRRGDAFNRCGEGITSALVTGRAAGESILQAVESGGSAFASYAEAVATEMEACARVNRLIEESIGLNPFTRD